MDVYGLQILDAMLEAGNAAEEDAAASALEKKVLRHCAGPSEFPSPFFWVWGARETNKLSEPIK